MEQRLRQWRAGEEDLGRTVIRTRDFFEWFSEDDPPLFFRLM